MIKILVKVPHGKEKRFMGRIGTGAVFYRLSADRIFLLIERRLLGTSRKAKKLSGVEKVHLYVKYPNGHNDGIYDNAGNLLYSLACFLEDYLTPSFAKAKYKRFMPSK